MRLLTLFTAALSSAALSAQPTLTQATNGFTIGQSLSLNYSPFADPGFAGPNQTWDFASLVVDSSTTVQWVDPATTTSGALFPLATIAELWDVVSFSDQDATGLYVQGSDEQGTVVALTDTRRALMWPLTYDDSWTDTYAGTYSVAGFDVTRTGTYSGEADAYGTLQLPWGTVVNALRVHITAEQSDESPFATLEQDIDSYQWFVVGEPWPVLEVVSNTINSPLGTFTTTYSLWRADAITGMPDPGSAVSDALQGWVVPGGASLWLNRPVSGVLLDASGRVAAALNRQSLIDLTGLAPGLYTVRTEDGATMRLLR